MGGRVAEGDERVNFWQPSAMPAASRRDPRLAAGMVALAAIAVLIGGAFAGMAVEGATDFAAALRRSTPTIAASPFSRCGRRLLSTVLSVGAGDHRRPRPVAASGFPGPRAGAAAVRAAAGAAGDRGRARHARALRPRRLFCRLAFVAVAAGIGRASTACPAFWSRMSFFNLPLATRLLLEALEACRPTSGGWRASSAWAPARHSG